MLKEQIGWNMEVYADDLLTKGQESEQHMADVMETFAVLQKYKMKLNLMKYALGVESSKFLSFMVSKRGIETNLEKIQSIINMKPPKNSMRFRK